MTKVEFFKEGGKYSRFSLKGHACYNEHGPDILCSAISMASQMTLNGLTEVAKVKVAVDEEDGYLLVVIQGETNDIAEALIESLYLGIEDLFNQHPMFIALSRIERGE